MKKTKKTNLIFSSECFYREQQEDGSVLYIPFGDALSKLIKKSRIEGIEIGQRDAYMKAIYKIEELPEKIKRTEAIMVIKELHKKIT